MRYSILVPYLLRFFGPILLMGLPIFRFYRRLWFITVTTTVLLLGSMGIAIWEKCPYPRYPGGNPRRAIGIREESFDC